MLPRKLEKDGICDSCEWIGWKRGESVSGAIDYSTDVYITSGSLTTVNGTIPCNFVDYR